MTDRRLYELSGVAMIAGAIMTAAFWLMTVPLGTFVGGAVPLDPLWIPMQTLHVLGALCAAFGFIGVYLAERKETKTLGLIGLVLVMTGTVGFLADGLIALFVFPPVARTVPEILSPEGLMNRGSVLALFITIAVINMLGNIIFGAATEIAGVFPSAAAYLLIAGGILSNLPPGPVPMYVLAIGGVLWSIGAAGLGWWLRIYARSASTG